MGWGERRGTSYSNYELSYTNSDDGAWVSKKETYPKRGINIGHFGTVEDAINAVERMENGEEGELF